MLPNQLILMAMTKELAAAARAQPMSFRPSFGQKSQTIDDIFHLVRRTQGLGIGFLKTFASVSPLTEGPRPGLLVPVLS